MKKRRIALLAAGAASVVTILTAQKPEGVDVQVVGHIVTATQLEPTDERVATLKPPAGFRVQKFASELGKPRMMAVAEDGSVYVTRREPGDCLLLKDTNGDGKADQQTVVAKREQLHGITTHNNHVYFATIKEVYVADRKEDGSLGELKQLISDLPDGGQHPNRTLGVGPDNMLYITVGSTCNACPEPNEEHATMLRAKLDGSGREIFASGLRNTLGFAWHPQTGELWGMDHNTDWLGDDEHPEELNHIVQGQKYGWPFVHGKSRFHPGLKPPDGKTREQWAKESREPTLLHTAHSAPMQMIFYTADQFPAEYRNDAFVAMRGSWNRKPPSGYEVVRIRFQNGKPTAIEPFLTGFLVQHGSGWGMLGRPVGLAIARDGSLLVGDDTNGVIYRVWDAEAEQTRSRQKQ